MAATYTLIASTVLTGSQASVVFSSIPQTFTDLVLKMSARSVKTGVAQENLAIQLNSNLSNYSSTELYSNGGSASSVRETTTTPGNNYFSVTNILPAATATANTFGNGEIYLPNYANTSFNKPLSVNAVAENNVATSSYISTEASLYSLTSAIDTITVFPLANSFASGSSFYLYGIKNS